ncbi:MAG: FtsW/RodA/SpoVE family cell cycle protein [Lachnospiraceae bacterium]
MINKLREYNFKKYDLTILILAILLGVIGAYILKVMPGTERYYLKQLTGIAIGVGIAVFVSLFDYHFVAKFYILLYLFNFGLLFLVKFTSFGIDKYGAKRWLGINDVLSFQPSELTKVIMIIVIAKYFDLLKNKLDKLYTLLGAAVIMAIPTFLVLIQTDLSTSIVLVVCFAAMVFISGYSLKILLCVAAVGVPILFGLFWYIQQPGQLLLTENQQSRVLSLLNPEAYPDLIYQQANAVKAIKSGGLMGKLFTGDTGVRGTAYVPVKESDFIFTGIGEELGFVGAALVILIISILVFRILLIAAHASDIMGRIIAAGGATIFMVQSFINIGVVSMILPNTGIPLPFVSSGLSSVVGSYAILGMVLNISMNTNKETKRGYHE